MVLIADIQLFKHSYMFLLCQKHCRGLEIRLVILYLALLCLKNYLAKYCV